MKSVKSTNDILVLLLPLYKAITREIVSLSLPSKFANSLAVCLLSPKEDIITVLTKFNLVRVALLSLEANRELSLLFNIKLANSKGDIVVARLV